MADDFALDYEISRFNKLLDNVDFEYINSDFYTPTEFTLGFLKFAKLVYGGTLDSRTPNFHAHLVDALADTSFRKLVISVFRGGSKSSVMVIVLLFYLAVYRELPGLTNLSNAMFIGDNMLSGCKRTLDELKSVYEDNEALQALIPKAKFTMNYIYFTNYKNEKFIIRLVGADSGIRGTRINKKRPQIVIMDDLYKDSDASSELKRDAIEKLVYATLTPALDPLRNKIILLGTVLHPQDIIVKCCVNPLWKTVLVPIAQTFPCTREEFVGAWPDRFSYDYVNDEYRAAQESGLGALYLQEMMMIIDKDTNKLLRTSDISFYEPHELNRTRCNYYITTDFAFTEKRNSDFSVISVWGYSPNGELFLVDGWLGREPAYVVMDKLFDFCSEYNPILTGLEYAGQQKGMIDWFRSLCLSREEFYGLASNQKDFSAGIVPKLDKATRFTTVVPLIKNGTIKFPSHLKDTPYMKEALHEMTEISLTGLPKHDDVIDTISMLSEIKMFPKEIPTIKIEPSLREKFSNFKIQSEQFLKDHPMERYL